MEPAKRTSHRLHNMDDMEVGYTMSQAIAEASRCLLCHDPPCTKSCPAGTDPGKFIWKLRMRNVKGAIRTIKQNNILGGVCGVACPVDKLCQEACSATEIDRPIEIGKLQRFLVEHGWRIGFDPFDKAPEKKDARVAIIGSGPAGLACAAELARAGIGATIFEARPEPGGVLRYGVPRFRLHEKFLERELEDVRKLGVEIKCGSRIKPKEADKLLKKGYAAVFIATGIWAPYRLALPGAQLKNVTTATELLEAARERGAAVKKMVKGKNVAIVGGGSVAMDVANTCKGLGADRVYCICLEGPAEIPADRTDLAMALANFVVIKPHAQVTEILGKGGKVVEVRGNETEWIKPGLLAPQNARAVPGTKFQLRVDVVVFAIGSGPERENLQLATSVKHSKNGLVQTKTDGVSTSDGKILAGGDGVRGPALIVHAVADGKEAARKIIGTLAAREGSHD